MRGENTPTRKKLGWIVTVLAVLTLYGIVRPLDSVTQGALVRTFLETGALWLAWPELVRLPKWVWLSIPVVVIVGAFRPQILIVAVPLFLLVLYLTPKK